MNSLQKQSIKNKLNKAWFYTRLTFFLFIGTIIFGSFLMVSLKTSEPVLASWNRIKDVSPQEVVHNSGGQQFMPIPATNGDKLERMIEMKNKMDSPLDDYGVFNLYQKSKEANINPSVPFCIGVADSQLGTQGRAKRTKNIGNIAHYDSGGTNYFKTYKEGLEAIVWLLSREQYRNTDTIGEISNGGRILLGLDPDCGDWEKGNKCWATSNENHYVNVVRCVREIEDDMSIDYTYNFR